MCVLIRCLFSETIIFAQKPMAHLSSTATFPSFPPFFLHSPIFTLVKLPSTWSISGTFAVCVRALSLCTLENYVISSLILLILLMIRFRCGRLLIHQFHHVLLGTCGALLVLLQLGSNSVLFLFFLGNY